MSTLASTYAQTVHWVRCEKEAKISILKCVAMRWCQPRGGDVIRATRETFTNSRYEHVLVQCVPRQSTWMQKCIKKHLMPLIVQVGFVLENLMCPKPNGCQYQAGGILTQGMSAVVRKHDSLKRNVLHEFMRVMTQNDSVETYAHAFFMFPSECVCERVWAHVWVCVCGRDRLPSGVNKTKRKERKRNANFHSNKERPKIHLFAVAVRLVRSTNDECHLFGNMARFVVKHNDDVATSFSSFYFKNCFA